MTCHRSGRPPTSTIGFGRNSVSSRMRVPRPPHRRTTFTSPLVAEGFMGLQIGTRGVPLDTRTRTSRNSGAAGRQCERALVPRGELVPAGGLVHAERLAVDLVDAGALARLRELGLVGVLEPAVPAEA